MSSSLRCPHCREALSLEAVTDKKGEINILIACEWCEEYNLRLKTDVKIKDLEKFANLKRLHKIEASIGHIPRKWQYLI